MRCTSASSGPSRVISRHSANLFRPHEGQFCGITRIEDAREAARLEAWAIGLNHWQQSPRRCDPGTAVQISAEMRRAVRVVGVFVNPTLDELARRPRTSRSPCCSFTATRAPTSAARRRGVPAAR